MAQAILNVSKAPAEKLNMNKMEMFQLLRKLWLEGKVKNRFELEVLAEILAESFMKRARRQSLGGPEDSKILKNRALERAQKALFRDLDRSFKILSYGK